MQRRMKLVGTKPYAYDIDGRSIAGTTCYFTFSDPEVSGIGTYCGNLSNRDAVNTAIEEGAEYIVVTDKAQGRMLGMLLF